MTPAEARAYWRAHEERFSDIDWERDPDGLSGYLGPGQPEWLNRRYAALQRHVFERLLARLETPGPGHSALDVGCGAGRWTRLLAAHGYAAVGLDLQERIIEANRRRFPHIEWHATALQDFDDDRRFDLVTAVGVLEMIPYVEQGDAVRRVARAVAPGGHAIVLAALSHPSANAFPHASRDWIQILGAGGLEPVEAIGFGWEPLRRTAAAAVRRLAPSRTLTPPLPTEAAPLDAGRPAGETWRAPAVLRTVAAVDDRFEPLLQRLRPRRVQPRWGAFLLRCG